MPTPQFIGFKSAFCSKLGINPSDADWEGKLEERIASYRRGSQPFLHQFKEIIARDYSPTEAERSELQQFLANNYPDVLPLFTALLETFPLPADSTPAAAPTESLEAFVERTLREEKRDNEGFFDTITEELMLLPVIVNPSGTMYDILTLVMHCNPDEPRDPNTRDLITGYSFDRKQYNLLEAWFRSKSSDRLAEWHRKREAENLPTPTDLYNALREGKSLSTLINEIRARRAAAESARGAATTARSASPRDMSGGAAAAAENTGDGAGRRIPGLGKDGGGAGGAGGSGGGSEGAWATTVGAPLRMPPASAPRATEEFTSIPVGAAGGSATALIVSPPLALSEEGLAFKEALQKKMSQGRGTIEDFASLGLTDERLARLYTAFALYLTEAPRGLPLPVFIDSLATLLRNPDILTVLNFNPDYIFGLMGVIENTFNEELYQWFNNRIMPAEGGRSSSRRWTLQIENLAIHLADFLRRYQPLLNRLTDADQARFLQAVLHIDLSNSQREFIDNDESSDFPRTRTTHFSTGRSRLADRRVLENPSEPSGFPRIWTTRFSAGRSRLTDRRTLENTEIKRRLHCLAGRIQTFERAIERDALEFTASFSSFEYPEVTTCYQKGWIKLTFPNFIFRSLRHSFYYGEFFDSKFKGRMFNVKCVDLVIKIRQITTCPLLRGLLDLTLNLEQPLPSESPEQYFCRVTRERAKFEFVVEASVENVPQRIQALAILNWLSVFKASLLAQLESHPELQDSQGIRDLKQLWENRTGPHANNFEFERTFDTAVKGEDLERSILSTFAAIRKILIDRKNDKRGTEGLLCTLGVVKRSE
ncbi:MAG TPA: U-box domain-containing protein, partial [Coxiellaceae bacterium]|nr:U-box domain-containing protein [Coxiellaceae bacterium]